MRADAAEAALVAGQGRVLEMIAGGRPLAETLRAIVELIETSAPDMVASIVLLDDDGVHMRHGAAGRLPEELWRTIDGCRIGPGIGSCGAALHRRAPVVAEDIEADPLWAEYRHLAVPHGLRACWSTPIFDPLHRVLGSFALYFRQPGRPAERHIRLIELVAHVAAIAIVRDHGERERARLLHDLSERVKELTTLHRVAHLLQQPRGVDHALLAELAALLPASWQYPGVCQARVAYGELEARTPGWRASPWIQAAAFHTGDGVAGAIQIAYLEQRPAAAEGPFLAEERKLIDAIADLLASHLERARLQREIAGRDQRFRGVLDSMSVGFVAMDRDLRFLYVNARAEQILGRTAGGIVGKTYREAFPEAAGSAFETAYRKALDERVPMRTVDYFAPWQRWFEQRVDPTPEGIAVFFEEVADGRRGATGG